VKLLIFSPVTVSSAIGRVTGLVVQALAAQGHEVVIVRSEDTSRVEATTHALGAKIVRWDDAYRVKAVAETADAVVYQMGNNYEFHCGCLEWLPKLPGIVCLHDYFLGGLFHGWAASREHQAKAVLQAWYGDDVANRYFSYRDSAQFIEATFETAPLTEWVASMAHGVLTHSSWSIDRVLDSCPGPVCVVPLPYDAPKPGRPQSTGDPDASAAEFTVLTLGHINPNKRADSVIRAIAESPRLRDVTLYRLVGRIEPAVEEHLTSLADGLGVRLAISGEVSDAVLQEALGKADVVCCLRLPALEAASASAIEAMLYAKAVIVMDTGFYQELPDAYVRKVSPQREIQDLRAELDALYVDPGQRRALGLGAAEWAEQTFRADNYAERLTGFCTMVAEAAPAVRASRFYAELLARWGASKDLLPATDIVSLLRPLGR